MEYSTGNRLSASLNGEQAKKTGAYLRDAYMNGCLPENGNIRHILTSDDHDSSSAWESSLAEKGRLPEWWILGNSGWMGMRCHCQTDPSTARKLAAEYINELRKEDFRKGPSFGAPWECYNSKVLRTLFT